MMIPNSSKTCKCGHVFEDIKQIAGKRFSEYRAELYWRLENKRMKALSKENKPLNGVSADPNNNTDNSSDVLSEKMKVVDRTVAVIPKSAQLSKKRAFRRRVGLYPTSKKHPKPSHLIYQCLDSTSEKIVSPEKLQRLSKALEEINKKIHSQNLVWRSLLS